MAPVLHGLNPQRRRRVVVVACETDFIQLVLGRQWLELSPCIFLTHNAGVCLWVCSLCSVCSVSEDYAWWWLFYADVGNWSILVWASSGWAIGTICGDDDTQVQRYSVWDLSLAERWSCDHGLMFQWHQCADLCTLYGHMSTSHHIELWSTIMWLCIYLWSQLNVCVIIIDYEIYVW